MQLKTYTASHIRALLKTGILGNIDARSGFLFLLLMLPATVEAQLNFSSFNRKVQIETPPNCGYSELTIPNSLEGYPVVSIGFFAFQDCSKLVSIIIPSSVTNISPYAFTRCTGLTNVVIPSSVTRLGTHVFDGCIKLANLNLPNSITNIPPYAFYGCTNLININIPDFLTSIGDGAFDSCANLTSATFPRSITKIGVGAFQKCARLTSVTIPSSVSEIGGGAFSSCNNLTAISVDPENLNYSSREGVLFNKAQTTLIQWPGSKAEGSIPETVTKIEGGAFSFNETLRSIIIPDTISSISSAMFAGCKSLESVTIPSSVTNISDKAFMRCTSLKAITIPDHIGSLEIGVFAECASLERFTMPDAVTNISGSAFAGCSNLASITIPGNVTRIGDHAFYNCSSLTNITIPRSVSSIGDFAFSGCSRLISITVEEGNLEYSSVGGVLFNKSQTVVIHCPRAKAEQFTIPSTTITISPSAFNGCTALTNVALPGSVTSIGDEAFRDCLSLTGIAIPSSVITIGKWAFLDCTTLANINVEADNMNYGSLDGVLFNKNRTKLVLYPCAREGQYRIPGQVTSIGAFAFRNCTRLTSVTMPGSVTNIESWAFLGCTNLAGFIVDADNPNYDTVDGVLYNKSRTTLIQCPEGKAGSCVIPSSVNRVESYAFNNCPRLESIYFKGNVPYPDLFAFNFYPPRTIGYYLPGTTGWESARIGLPTALWNPRVQTGGNGFGVRSNRFGFYINGPTNLELVVEATTNLTQPLWIPVSTNTLTGGTSYFSDPQWTDRRNGFYRLRSP